MTCYHPVTCWRAKDPNASGKRSLVFVEARGDGASLQIPCGGCVGCRLDRAAEWQSRLVHESKMHLFNVFLTLTYSDENLPENGTLVKDHFQKFMMRLRKSIYPTKVRYYMCGEYGSQTQRPHYHAILFGHDFADKKYHKKTPQGDKLYISNTLDRLWGHGHCWIGSVTPESCGYVARYIMKKITGDAAELHYTRLNPETGELIPILPEYTNMSLKPAIGLTFYEKYHKEIHTQDSVIINGRLRKTPRYYDKQLDKKDPFRLEDIKYERTLKAKDREVDNTPERLAVREEFKKERIKNLVRKFL